MYKSKDKCHGSAHSPGRFKRCCICELPELTSNIHYSQKVWGYSLGQLFSQHVISPGKVIVKVIVKVIGAFWNFTRKPNIPNQRRRSCSSVDFPLFLS